LISHPLLLLLLLLLLLPLLFVCNFISLILLFNKYIFLLRGKYSCGGREKKEQEGNKIADEEGNEVVVAEEGKLNRGCDEKTRILLKENSIFSEYLCV